jgi:hypothetical protein
MTLPARTPEMAKEQKTSRYSYEDVYHDEEFES